MLFFIKLAIASITVFALSWIPLVGAYDYEAALCIALAGVFFIPILTPAKTEDTKAWFWKPLVSALLFWLFANGSTLIVAWLRNELCDFSAGLKYQLLISLPSTLLSAVVWGWSNALSKNKFVRVLSYVLVVLIDFAAALFALYTWPPLVAFGHFFGYFAGSIYDEAIHVTQSLLLYRIGTLLLISLFTAAQLGSPKIARKLLCPLLGAAIACGWHFTLAHFEVLPVLGRSELNETLWMKVSSPDMAWTVHFMPRSKHRSAIAEQATQIYNEYARDFAWLEKFFNNRPSAPIDIWLYPDYDQKARFLAARNTSFARVWKHEIHLVEGSPRDTTPRHEMAHLFAEEFSSTPLGLAGSGLIPAMGWVEGLAMAAEWRQNEYNLHTWSAAIFENKPDIATPTHLLYGFWSLPSNIAYTLSGSFVHWLIERYGIDKVKQLSRSSMGSFEDILGISSDEAFAAWQLDICSRYASQRAQELAKLYFDRPSIWTKHCARSHAAASATFNQCLTDVSCPLETLAACEVMPTSEILNLSQPQVIASISLQDLNVMWQLYRLSDPLSQASTPHFLQNNQNSHALLNLSHAAYRDWIRQAHALLSLKITSKSEQLIWSERVADMMWDEGNGVIAHFMYALLSTETLPLGQRARIAFKQQAAISLHSPVSKAMQRLLFTTDPEERELIYNQFDQAPSIAFFELQDAVDSRQHERALHAFAQILLHSGTQDQAERLPPAALPLVVDLMLHL